MMHRHMLLALTLWATPIPAVHAEPVVGERFTLQNSISTELVNRPRDSPCLQEVGGSYVIAAIDDRHRLWVRYYQPPSPQTARPCPSRLTMCVVEPEQWAPRVERMAMPMAAAEPPPFDLPHPDPPLEPEPTTTPGVHP